MGKGRPECRAICNIWERRVQRPSAPRCGTIAYGKTHHIRARFVLTRCTGSSPPFHRLDLTSKPRPPRTAGCWSVPIVHRHNLASRTCGEVARVGRSQHRRQQVDTGLEGRSVARIVRDINGVWYGRRGAQGELRASASSDVSHRRNAGRMRGRRRCRCMSTNHGM